MEKNWASSKKPRKAVRVILTGIREQRAAHESNAMLVGMVAPGPKHSDSEQRSYRSKFVAKEYRT